MSIQLRSRVRRSDLRPHSVQGRGEFFQASGVAGDIALKLVLSPKDEPQNFRVLLDSLSMRRDRRPLARGGHGQRIEPGGGAMEELAPRPLLGQGGLAAQGLGNRADQTVVIGRSDDRVEQEFEKVLVALEALQDIGGGAQLLHVERHHEVDRRCEIDPQGPLDMRLPIALPLEQLKLHAGVARRRAR